MISYEVTSEPISDVPENEMPPELADDMDRLYYLCQDDPRAAIIELERLIEQYPDCPKLLNFLSVAYLGIGDIDRLEQVARENFERFPDYLFAKLNYADVCMRRGNLDAVPVIFGGKYHLTLVCPGRHRFHVTEAVGFMELMTIYFMRRGEFEKARSYHEVLSKIAPDDPRTREIGQLILLANVSTGLGRLLQRKPKRAT